MIENCIIKSQYIIVLSRFKTYLFQAHRTLHNLVLNIAKPFFRCLCILHYALIPIFLEFRSSDLYYISKCRNDGPINESSLKNGPTIAIVRGLANIWFFNVLLLNRAIFGMFEGVQEGIRTQFFCGEIKFNIIATSRNVLRLWKHFWRPLEAA